MRKSQFELFSGGIASFLNTWWRENPAESFLKWQMVKAPLVSPLEAAPSRNVCGHFSGRLSLPLHSLNTDISVLILGLEMDQMVGKGNAFAPDVCKHTPLSWLLTLLWLDLLSGESAGPSVGRPRRRSHPGKTLVMWAAALCPLRKLVF